MITIFFFIAIFLYSAMMLYFRVGWQSLEIRKSGSKVSDNVKVSIVVAARNESNNLPLLLEDISFQKYQNFEVIIVDDHSEDNSIAVLQELKIKYDFDFSFYQLEEGVLGKKAALKKGLDQAKGDLILLTDADCRLLDTWVKAFSYYYQKSEAKFISGPVDFLSSSNLFNRIQRMEFFGLTGSGAASLFYNMPTMCNGANICFEKAAFRQIGGYEGLDGVASGDDVLLMMKMTETFSHSVHFIKDLEALVLTKYQTSVKDFIAQRKRWASKFGVYKGLGVRLVALNVFLVYLAVLLSIGGLFFNAVSPLYFLIGILIKLSVDYLFLHSVSSFYRRKFDDGAFLLLQLLMPPYVVFFGLAGRFGKFSWKGRITN